MRMIVIAMVIAAMTGVFFISNNAIAEVMPSNAEIMKEVMTLKGIIEKQNMRIMKLEKRVVREGEVNIRQSETMDTRTATLERLRGIREAFEGLEIGVAGTFIGQGTTDANNVGDGQHKSRFDGSYSADLTIEKQFGDYGTAFAYLEAGQGAGLTDKLSVFSNVNYDATAGNNTAEWLEFWYQQYLFDRQVMLTAGKLDPTCFIDTNEYANDECTQFIGDIFRNAPTIEFPGNAFGGRIYLTSGFLLNCVEVEAVYMDSSATGWDDLMNKGFVGTQVNFMPARAFGYDEDMWGGNYRAYFWANGANHVKIEDPEERTKEENYGLGISCDQRLTEIFGVFGRFGWANPEVYVGDNNSGIEYTWSTGLQMTGEYWNREEDIVAVGVGQVIPGEDYRDTVDTHKNETHLEAYYSYKVNDHLTLSPDLQVIWDPNGDGNERYIFIYGIRGQVDY